MDLSKLNLREIQEFLQVNNVNGSIQNPLQEAVNLYLRAYQNGIYPNFNVAMGALFKSVNYKPRLNKLYQTHEILNIDNEEFNRLATLYQIDPNLPYARVLLWRTLQLQGYIKDTNNISFISNFSYTLSLTPNICQIQVYPFFYNYTESSNIFRQLHTLNYEYTHYYLFGKFSRSPRKMLWFAENTNWTYFFSRNHVGGLKVNPFTPFLLEIKDKVERATGEQFNALLINEYRGGEDKIDPHKDSDPWLGSQFIVPSLSFGATRTFYIKSESDKNQVLSIKTLDGSMLVMEDNVQTNCKHYIKIEKKVTGIRYNLTFRKVIPELINRMPKGSSKSLEEAKRQFQ